MNNAKTHEDVGPDAIGGTGSPMAEYISLQRRRRYVPRIRRPPNNSFGQVGLCPWWHFQASHPASPKTHYGGAVIENFHAVIPAGGAGTRLWPLSRAAKPKFLLDLTGGGRTLLQQTWDRLEPLVGASNIHIVTGPGHAAAVAQQLPDLAPANLLVEPSPRDSMAAIGLAAAVIERANPGAVIGSFAADHVIHDDEGFRSSVTQAVAAAVAGKVCTIGITATRPSTSFGYIEAGDSLGLDAAPDAREVTRFVEKPDEDTARGYVETGHFWWNAGMFVMSAEVLLGHLADLHADMYVRLTAIAHAWTTDERKSLLDAQWPGLRKIAIDHAIAEPVAAVGGVAVVPGSFDWDDLGDFAALDALGDNAAATQDNVQFIDADGLVISTKGRAISVIGIPDVIVVDTGDALLVTTKEHAQRVKEAPAAWRARGRDDLT